MGAVTPQTVLPGSHFYRHSRVSGNPEPYCLMMVLSTGNRGIPAYAGRTVLFAPYPAGPTVKV